MALIRWQPFHEMDALQRDMNRMFEALASNNQGYTRQSFMPLAEMEQTENAVHLKVEVPGMKADDLDVQVTREAVMITGERKSELKSQKNGMTRSEFRYGSFSRTIPLPVPVDNNRVTGDYQDGILILELPKLQQKENKVTKVSIGSGNSKQDSSNPQIESGSNSASENISPDASEVSAKEVSGTHSSVEPAAKNTDVTADIGGYGRDAWDDSPSNSEESVAN